MEIVQLLEEKRGSFDRFHTLLSKANKKVNLVSDASKEVLHSHSLDSLLLHSYLKDSHKICDIGAGGGFPLIPLALTNPEKSFFAIDSSKRKCDFLTYAAEMLSLSNITVWHGRIEDAKHVATSFDTVTARALAPLKELIPLSLPLLNEEAKPHLLFLKGARYQEEITEAKDEIENSSLSLSTSQEFRDIPGRDLSVIISLQ